MNSKLISELVSSDKTVFLCINATQSMTNSDKHNNLFCACSIAKFSEYRDHTCFSCINICRVPMKLFEHEAVRPSVQTSSQGPGKC